MSKGFSIFMIVFIGVLSGALMAVVTEDLKIGGVWIVGYLYCAYRTWNYLEEK